MYQSIMVPLDGSPEGEAALPVARYLALESQATLHIVHVQTPVQVIFVESIPVIDEDLQSRSRDHALAYLQSIQQRIAAAPPIVSTIELLDGPIVPSLLEYAGSIAADLIVMSTHGRGGWQRAWLGSVADGLIRSSGLPILLVRQPEAADQPAINLPFRRIVVPLDGSPEAASILARIEQLDPGHAADLVLLRVLTLDVSDISANARGLSAAETYLDTIAQRLDRQRRIHTRVMTDPQPAQAILRYAVAHECDLIALCTHGYGGWRRLLIGGVADKLIRGATTPVLVLRTQPAP